MFDIFDCLSMKCICLCDGVLYKKQKKTNAHCGVQFFFKKKDEKIYQKMHEIIWKNETYV